MTDDHPRYGAIAIALHWLMFALIVSTWSLALYMVDLPLSPQKLKYFSWHKWIGVTIFLLLVIRVAWRFAYSPPPLPDSMPSWERVAAGVSHLLLYLLILVIPITGWLYSSATGIPTVYLGWVQLPDLVERDKLLADLLKQLHIFLNWLLFIIVGIHTAAAFKHHFLDHDHVLAGMIPFVRRTGTRGDARPPRQTRE